MKILVTDPLSDVGLQILKDAGFEILDYSDSKNSDYEDQLSEVNGWLIRSGTKITADFINKSPNLKVVGRAGVGVDNIDIPAATMHGIVVMNTPSVNTISAAEHTIALILAIARNVHLGYSSLLDGRWDRSKLVGTELRGKKLGVIGLGRIGTEVIKRLHPFGMEILGYDPFISADTYDLDYVKCVELDYLCENSDIITIHVPMLEATKGLFNYKRLQMMKSTALLINCARGGIIVDEDLKRALDGGVIAGAAIDVFNSEPPIGNPLLESKNLLFTPHLGASTHEAKEGVSITICKQVRDYLLDGKLENALNVPIPDISLLESLQPYLDLAEKLGIIHQQVTSKPAKTITIETQGSLDDVKLTTLAFLKGFLSTVHGSSVNFVNATVLAESRGINVKQTYSQGDGDYSNLIIANVEYEDRTLEIRGSLFSEKHARIIYFDGFHLDLTTSGNILIIYNKDVPGVVGKVGTYLAQHNINIANYQLGRKDGSDNAIGIIRLDAPLNEKELKGLTKFEEISMAKQVIL